ncbi:MAG: hypothetical protein IPK82_23240 [Polyangiaceae bacterium]|nr:hypothetical protein [Polyangiaceae bacterium]
MTHRAKQQKSLQQASVADRDWPVAIGHICSPLVSTVTGDVTRSIDIEKFVFEIILEKKTTIHNRLILVTTTVTVDAKGDEGDVFVTSQETRRHRSPLFTIGVYGDGGL